MKNKKYRYNQKKDIKLLITLDCFRHSIKMEYHKITNLLGTTSNSLPRFIARKQIEADDQSDSVEHRYKPNKQIRF